jgi:CBS domain containing-hemolysin-like protein
MGVALSLIAALVLVAANAFFVAVEFSLVATDRTQVELDAARGDRRAALVARALSRVSFHLSGVQLGITLCSVILGFLAEPAVAKLLRPLLDDVLSPGQARTVSLALALALATVVQMVVGELIPKAVAVARPSETAKALAPAHRVVAAVFFPLIRVFNGAADRIVRMFGIEPQEELGEVRSRSELVRLVAESAAGGSLQDTEATLLTRAFRFGEKSVAEVLTPRTDVVALSIEDSGADLLARTTDTGFSRFPVTGRDLDDVVGVVLVKALLDLPAEQRARAVVEDLMDAPLLVPETRPLDEVLVEMRQGAGSLAVVLDEYGGTAGIVTLEDLVEEIVGEIDDEHDVRTTPPSPLLPGPRVVGGGLHADELRELVGLELPEGDYETLAGFLMVCLGRVAREGDHVEHDGWGFEVVGMDRHRIESVRVSTPVEDEARGWWWPPPRRGWR